MRIPHLPLILTALAWGLAAAPSSASTELALDLDLLRGASTLILHARGAVLVSPSLQAAEDRTSADEDPLKKRKKRSGDGGSSGSTGSSGASSGSYVNPALRGVGVGLQVGTPTALTFKLGAQGNANIVLGVGAGFGFRDLGRFGLSLHGDYLFTVATLVKNGDIALDAYVGPGLWLTLFDRGYGYIGGFYYYGGVDFLGIGVRVPLGLNMRFTQAPIEIYLELDPAIFVFPGVDGFLGASLGFRWFF